MRGGDSSHWPPSAATTIAAAATQALARPVTSPVKMITATMSSSRYAATWFSGRPMAATAKARAAALRHPAPAPPAARAGGAPSRGDIIKVPM
jgi:hypothetical protein